MSMSGESGQRVGNAEREAAVQALNQHWQAGRLDPAEHERRTTAAYAAVTRGDLDALFKDLPSGDPGPPPSTPAPVQGRVVEQPAGVDEPAGSAAAWVRRNRNAVMGAMPFIALVLFFATKWWVWFLLIPAAGAILYAGGGDDDGRGRDRNRRQG